jgi:hypothetical protein
MTYKEKMDKEHPIVDPDYIMFSCPGHYFENAPNCNRENCPQRFSKVTCYQCWCQEITEQSVSEKTPIDIHKIAARVKEIYKIFRDEELNHQEAFEITKIIIAEEVRYGMSGRKDLPV